MTDAKESTDAMRVSIIIPAFNAAKHLAATVESVLAQTWTDWELVIVDDGSTDTTADIALQFADRDPRIRVIKQQNAGQSVARNVGYVQTDPSSEGIVFLDADDVWEPDALNALCTALQAQPAMLAAYGMARYIDAEGQVIRAGELERHQRERLGLEGNRLVPWPLDRPTSFAVEAVTERIITGGTVLIRRSTLAKSGLFNPQIRFWEDWDLWLRICRYGEIAFLDRVILGYRRHESNLSNDEEALTVGAAEVRNNLIESLADDPARQQIARWGAVWHRREVSKMRMRWAKQSLAHGKILDALRQVRHAYIESNQK